MGEREDMKSLWEKSCPARALGAWSKFNSEAAFGLRRSIEGKHSVTACRVFAPRKMTHGLEGNIPRDGTFDLSLLMLAPLM